MLSPEVQSKFDHYRRRIEAGEKIPPTEMREVVAMLRGDRRTAAAQPTSRSARAKSSPRSADDLLGELDAL